MAKITITFEDFQQDGRAAVSCMMKVEPAKHDAGETVTDATIVGIAAKRLWDSQALLRIAKDVCADVIDARRDAA